MADPTAIIVVIGGVEVTRFARVGRVRIDDLLNDAPNTAALTIVIAPRFGPPEAGAFDAGGFDAGGFAVQFNNAPILPPPTIHTGAPIQMYLGTIAAATQIFGGQITTREQYAEFDIPKHVRYDLTCIDWTRRLNYRKVTKEYGSASATAIVTDLIATFAPPITTANVQPNLETIAGGMTFTFEEVSRSLSRVAKIIGAKWYTDYAGDLHFFVGSEPGTDPAPIVPGADFANFCISADMTQVRTRIILEGDGATALITLPSGDAITPVSQTTPFNPAGGRAKLGPTMITYSGIQVGGTKTNTVGVGGSGTAPVPPPDPPGAPFATVAGAGVAGALAGGPYTYAVTLEMNDGRRSAIGAVSNAITIAPAANAAAPGVTQDGASTLIQKGPIAVGVASSYVATFLDGKGGETAAINASGTVTGRAVPNPVGSAGFGGGAVGAIEPGWYQWAYTFLTPTGETVPAYTAIVEVTNVSGTGGGTQVLLPMPQSPTYNEGRVIGRRVYRSTRSATSGAIVLPWRHCGDVPNPTDDRFVDTRPDSERPAVTLPAYNTATDVGEAVTVAVPTSPDARITRRRLYRKDGGGEYRLVVELPDNVATTFRDVAPAAGGNMAPRDNTIRTGAVNLTAIPIGPSGTARRRIFRTAAGGSQFRELTAISDNTATTFTDVEADASLGGSPLPAQGLAGSGGEAPPAPAGSTTLQVASLEGFPPAGWVAVESQMIRYTGGTSVGGWFLTGIPASGPGAIVADIPVGTVVTTSPALVGIAPTAPITLGDAVQLIVIVNDAAAQASIAAVEGGDGVIEHYIQDRRLSEAGAKERGEAELALFRSVELQLTYSTRDPQTRSGRIVHVDLPAPTNLTGDFLIQRVTIDDVSVAPNFYPRRYVEAAATRFGLEEVLARLLMEQS